MNPKCKARLQDATRLCTDQFQIQLVLGLETIGCRELAGKSDADRQGHINSAQALMRLLTQAHIRYYLQPDLSGCLYDSRILIS